jgi:hypothetical protein
MNCPNCGHPETARVKVCPACHEAYASQDLLALRRLEFLIAETASWEGAQHHLAPYQERLAALRKRLIRRPPEVEEPHPAIQVVPPAEPEPLPLPAETAPTSAPARVPVPVAATPVPTQEPPPSVVRLREPLHAAEPVEKVPFDQWLLSERNIKIALYAGALLLVIAGAIFVGVNWMRIPGPAKFAITLLVTGFTVLGGYLLFRRPAMRPGGVAVLAVACGFLALNFVVLQIYVLGPAGLRDELMWLIASPLCLVPYLGLALWTRSDLFFYIALGAVASTAAAALAAAGAPLAAYLLAAALLVTALLPLAWRLRITDLAEFTYRPLLYVTQGLMPVALLASLAHWLVAAGCTRCAEGSPWLAIAGLAVGVLFYAGTEWRHRAPVARWASTGLFTLVVTAIL